MADQQRENLRFDLIVIGSGPGGQRAAIQGAKAGKKVAIIEAHTAVGGGAVHYGTLPSKSLRESTYRWALSSRGTLSQEVDSTPTKAARRGELPDMVRLLKRKRRVVRMEAEVIFDQLQRNGVAIYQGVGSLVSENEVMITPLSGPPHSIRGDYVVIATGSRPRRPPNCQLDHKTIVDSDSVLELKRLPKSMIVLGAGVIGSEYAAIFATAGTKVTLIDKYEDILSFIDREIVEHLLGRFRYHGMELKLGVEVDCAETVMRKSKGVEEPRGRVKLKDGSTIEAEVVLVCQGRVGNVENLGLEPLGIKIDKRGNVEVDKRFRTAVPNIYAVGDVVGFPALASTSMEQGRIACCDALGIKGEAVAEMPEEYPYGIYTIPEISTIGKTEEELKAAGVDYVVGRGRYREIARGQITGDQWGLLKMLVHRQTYEILGVHIIGDSAADLIHIGQAVMQLKGDARYFIHSVFNYPTLAEAYKTAAFNAVNLIHGRSRSR